MEADMVYHHRIVLASAAMAAALTFAATSDAQTATQAPAPAARAGLSLTQAQRDEIRTLREALRKDAQPLREQMRAARLQLRQAMSADVPDEAAVRSAAAAVGALQADQAAFRARQRAQFMKVLTPEQQSRVKAARERAAQRTMRAEGRTMRRHRMMRQQRDGWWRGGI
jgi:Spy/CpxP family protein refolding chaperone